MSCPARSSLRNDDAEIARLQGQAAIIAEPTDMLFRRGGLRPGMHRGLLRGDGHEFHRHVSLLERADPRGPEDPEPVSGARDRCAGHPA